MLANDIDADGDVLQITNCHAQRANGTVNVIGGSSSTRRTPAFIGTNSFDYTIDDQFGGVARQRSPSTSSPARMRPRPR